MTPKPRDKSNFGGYSQKFKKTDLSSDSGSPGYIESIERFSRKDICATEKKDKLENMERHNRGKLEIKKKWSDIIDFQQKVTDVKESLGQIKRTKNLFEYENRIIERNKLH